MKPSREALNTKKLQLAANEASEKLLLHRARRLGLVVEKSRIHAHTYYIAGKMDDDVCYGLDQLQAYINGVEHEVNA